MGLYDDDAVYTTKLPIGAFIVLVTLVTELAVNPIFEFLKNKLTNAIAIYKIAHAQPIVLRNDWLGSSLLGISDSLKNNTLFLRISYLLKLFFKCFIIGLIVYWESSANEVAVTKLFPQQLARGRDQISGTRIMSPMPFTGLSENEITRLVTFSPNGAEQTGTYVVLDGEAYKFTGDQQCTSVIDGKLTIYLSQVQITQDTVKRICLDGSDMKPTAVAAELNIQTRSQSTYDLNAITLNSEVNTDKLSIVYHASASHDGEDKVGYVALTKNSHQNGNTVWSFYGVLHNRGGKYLEYVNIPIYNNDFRCREQPIGIWKFSGEFVVCPDGTILTRPGGVKSKHVVNAKWVLPGGEFLRKEVSLSKLALQWVAETPFSDYVVKTKLAEEIWSRVNRQVYFVSDFQQTIELPGTETVMYTQTKRKRVVITSATLSVVLVILLLSFLLERLLSARYKINMDFTGIESVLRMWNSEVPHKSTNDGSHWLACDRSSGTAITVGLTQEGDVGPQHVGTVRKDSEVSRSGDDIADKMDASDMIELVRRYPERPLE